MENLRKTEICSAAVCARIKSLRIETSGTRGKSGFAKKLGLSPSTYDYYEKDRIPPSDVMYWITELTGVELRWIMTGQQPIESEFAPDHPIIRRVASMLAEHPNSAEALVAFLDIFSEAKRFPPKEHPGSDLRGGATLDQTDPPASRPATWVPILGRTAAGIPDFWSQGQDVGVTKLRELIDRHARQADQNVSPDRVERVHDDSDSVMQIITLGEIESGQTGEFVSGGKIKSRWADAFAVRIDGDSMAPDIHHGDLVILSLSEPAVNGRTAVVQLKDQIGVTCKIYHCTAGMAHLVPINEHFDTQVFPVEKVVWALRVLRTIRPE